MLHLTVAGLSGDNKRLLLVSDSGEQFSLAIDARLRAALRGEHARPRPVGDHHGEHAPSPRHPDTHPRRRVAGVGGPGGPDERRQDHAVRRTRAGRARPRRRPRPAFVRSAASAGDGAAPAPSVTRSPRHLRAAERRPDHRRLGRLAPRGRPLDADRRATSRPSARAPPTFAYDAPGNFVIAENDDARWLVGEAVATAPPLPPPATTSRRPASAGCTAVPEDELPLGDDAIELANRGADPDAATMDLTETAARVRGERRPTTPTSPPRPSRWPTSRTRSAPADRAERGRASRRRPEPEEPAARRSPRPPPSARAAAGPRCRAGTRSVRRQVGLISGPSALTQCPAASAADPAYSPAMSSYFVTGATGFIGRFLVQELVDNREGDIFVLVREGSLPRLETLLDAAGAATASSRSSVTWPRRTSASTRSGSPSTAATSPTSSTSPRSTT